MGIKYLLYSKCVKACFFIQRKLRRALWRGDVIIWEAGGDDALLTDIKNRLEFYLPGVSQSKFKVRRSLPIFSLVIGAPILQYCRNEPEPIWLKLFPRYRYLVDHRTEKAGWELFRLSNEYFSHKPDVDSSKDRFVRYLQRHHDSGLNCCYVFGTGPSLSRAGSRDWGDGYRVVCNTIVRDRELWHHINPHVIVAGDAIYHFSFTPFARAFRDDLKRRLAETDTLFVYPETFDVFVKRELKEFIDRLVPVPVGGHRRVHVDLAKKFSLPSGGNVLPILLLPVACSFSKKIRLWGFDGRSPTDGDVPFWANSDKQNYPELMHTLIASFPGFFVHHVPNNDSRKYVESVQGEKFEKQLSEAESEGYEFMMMHHSWTPTLSKRFDQAAS